FGFAENTDDLFVGKTLLHGDVLMWLMKTLLTSGCTNQRGAGHSLLKVTFTFNKKWSDITRGDLNFILITIKGSFMVFSKKILQ
ncbi:hypothetical protein, partial [Klebsiella pneumoniae]|uniref:hypothetical protein n=1 Tax=Klebsiella pneumoniae TaxID=573 RepID=UPI001D0E2CBA